MLRFFFAQPVSQCKKVTLKLCIPPYMCYNDRV